MNTNNTLLTLTTVAMVFAGAADAANSDLMHIEPSLNNQIQKVRQVEVIGNPVKCAPGSPKPECNPNDDCVCIAA